MGFRVRGFEFRVGLRQLCGPLVFAFYAFIRVRAWRYAVPFGRFLTPPNLPLSGEGLGCALLRGGCLFIFLLLPDLGWGGDFVRFFSHATVSSRVVSLGQVAELSSGLKQFEDVVVGASPGRGQQVVWFKSDVVDRLKVFDSFFSVVGFLGPQQFVVKRSGFRVSGERLAGVGQSFLLGQLQDRFRRVEVEAVGRVSDQFFSLKDVVVRPEWSFSGQLKYREVVWLSLVVGEEVVNRVPVWFSVSAFADVWHVRSGVDVSSRLAVEDLVLSEAEVSRLSGVPVVFEVDVLAGWLAQRRLVFPVKPGGALSVKHFELRPVVALNQPLSVVASFGRARVQSAGVALSEGGVGDLVDVFVVGSGEAVSGRVLSSKLVVVQ